LENQIAVENKEIAREKREKIENISYIRVLWRISRANILSWQSCNGIIKQLLRMLNPKRFEKYQFRIEKKLMDFI